jgi:hypothetical protein
MPLLLEPGMHEVVVFDGDLAGEPKPVMVSPPQPIGQLDTAAGLVQLADNLTVAFAALDLSALYGEAYRPIVQEALAGFRASLAAVDPSDLPPEIAAGLRLDSVVDSSGLPELLRSKLADIARIGTGDLPPAQLASGLRLLGGFVRVAASALGPAAVEFEGADRLTAALGVVGLDAQVLAGVLLGPGASSGSAAGSDFFKPVITSLQFTDPYRPDGKAHRAVPSQDVFIRTPSTFLPESLVLLITTAAFAGGDALLHGTVTDSSGDFTRLRFRLPSTVGFCGAARIRLARGPFVSEPVEASIRPVLEEPISTETEAGQHFSLGVSGVHPCQPTEIWYTYSATSDRLEWRGYNVRTDVPSESSDPDILRVEAGVRRPGSRYIRDLLPGRYHVQIGVHGVFSEEIRFLEYRSTITGAEIGCVVGGCVIEQDTCVVILDEDAPERQLLCAVRSAPLPNFLLPARTLVRLSATDSLGLTRRLLVDEGPLDSFFFGVIPLRQGPALITAEVKAIRTFALEELRVFDDATLKVRVDDRARPTVEITAPTCGDTVAPGDTLIVTVDARDNLGLSLIKLQPRVNDTGTNLCVRPVTCDSLCESAKECTDRFTVRVPEELPPGDNAIVLRAEARDDAGNSRQQECRLAIVPPEPTVPMPTPTSPPTPVGTVPILLKATLEKIADSTLEVPAHNATFHNFRDPAVKDGVVVFIGEFREGSNISSTHGIFLWDGAEVELVADNVTLVPGSTERFRTYTGVSFDGDEVVFSGYAFNPASDLYRMPLGADPETGARLVLSFTSLELPIFSFSVRNGFVGGEADCSSAACQASPLGLRDLIYTASLAEGTDSFDIAARNGDPVPGRDATFTSTSALSFDFAADGPAVAFSGRGSDGQDGIYRVVRGGRPVKIADRNTRVPERQGNFRGFGTPAIAGAEVAFGAYVDSASAVRGIYATKRDTLMRVADSNTPAPGSAGKFVEFNRFVPVGYDQGVIVFVSTQPAGVFAAVDGVVTRILGVGDRLDDKVVNFIAFGGDDAMEGTQILLTVSFDGGSTGLYLATVERPQD